MLWTHTQFSELLDPKSGGVIMRKEKPSGREIADMAKKTRTRTDVVLGKKDGKNVKFTPAELEHLKDLDEFEDGQVIGILENELEGDETNLPQGKHNVFLSKVDGNWKAYAEAGGEISTEAARVEVSYHRLDERRSSQGKFHPEGWCFTICLIPFFWKCILSARICF